MDHPQEISLDIQRELGISNRRYNHFQAAYSIPSFILCIYSGIYIDKHGLRYGLTSQVAL